MRSLLHRHPRLLRALAAIACVVTIAIVVGDATGTSGTTVVTLAVPSSISLTNNCSSTSATSLGTILPGSTATTTSGVGACNVGFQSNNDSAMLKIATPAPGGTAMERSGFGTSQQMSTTALHQVSMADATHGYAVGDSGTVEVTTDGATWAATGASPNGSAIEGVVAVSATTAVVGTSNDRLYRTTNSGSSWTRVDGGVLHSSIIRMTAASATLLYAAASDGELATSGDGGVTWTAQAAIESGQTLEAISAVPATATAFALDYLGHVYRSINSGASWTLVSQPASGFGNAISAYDTTHLFVADDYGFVYYSADGGSTWSKTTPGGIITRDKFSIKDIVATGTSSATAVGFQGEIATTANGGGAWTIASDPSADGLLSVTANGASQFAVGDGKAVVASPDSGTTWSVDTWGLPDWFAVAAQSGTNAWVVGSGGSIDHTANGTSWSAQTSGTTSGLFAVTDADANDAWAVGAGGTILHTTTGGTAWTAQTSGTGQTLRGVTAGDANTAWAVGDGGVVLATFDGGATWTAQTSGTAANLAAVAVLGQGIVEAVGDSGTIIETTNYGNTWTTRVSGHANTLTSISSSDGQHVVVGGGDNMLLSSSDGGVTWSTVQAPGFGDVVLAVGAVSPTDVYFGNLGGFWISHDGGATSQGIDGNQTYAISMVDSSTGWEVGANEQIVKLSGDMNVPDYGGANTWSSGTASMFGVCLLSVGGGTTADWTAGPSCSVSDANPWNAVPTASTKVVHETTVGTAASATLVWGMKVAANQAPGTYRATVVFSAYAPNV